MWRGASFAFGTIFQWIQRFETSKAAVPWDGVRTAFRRMRAFLPFIYADLGRKLAPFLLAQDAAGPSHLGVQGPTGSFSLAVGFPNLDDLSKIFHSVQLRSRNSTSYSSVLKTALELATSEESPSDLRNRIDDGEHIESITNRHNLRSRFGEFRGDSDVSFLPGLCPFRVPKDFRD